MRISYAKRISFIYCENCFTHQIYSNTDHLRIIEEEYENEDGEKKYRYFIAAYFRDKGMTAEQINEFFEALADEIGE